MGLFALKEPVKQLDAEVICDLDSIIEKRAVCTLNGKQHYVEPVTNARFIEFSMKLAEIAKIKDDPKKVLGIFQEMISSMCPTISKDEINALTQAQSIMLYAAITDKVMGRSPMSEEEKKNS